MHRYFLDAKKFIENDPRYTDFVGNIHGSNYPPPAHAVIISKITSALWLGGIVLMIGGDSVFKFLHIAEPQWYVLMKNNKVASFGALFIMNSMGNSQLSTGAFEIYINDELFYSKLATHRLPNGEDLARIMAMAGYR